MAGDAGEGDEFQAPRPGYCVVKSPGPGGGPVGVLRSPDDQCRHAELSEQLIHRGQFSPIEGPEEPFQADAAFPVAGDCFGVAGKAVWCQQTLIMDHSPETESGAGHGPYFHKRGQGQRAAWNTHYCRSRRDVGGRPRSVSIAVRKDQALDTMRPPDREELSNDATRVVTDDVSRRDLQ